MGILSNIFWKINSTARDVRDVLSPAFFEHGFVLESKFVGSEKHMIYTKGLLEFDFKWERGNRPTLYLKKDGNQVEATVYKQLFDRHTPQNSTIGEKIYYINSKLDKDVYYNEHLLFVTDFIKKN
jgi:hypothetical protein